LGRALRPEDLPGLRARPVHFKPTFHKFAGLVCGGLQLHVGDRTKVRSLVASWAILRAAFQQAKGRAFWRTERYEFVDDRPAIDLLAGGSWLREAIEAGTPVRELVAAQADACAGFVARRRPFLRYL
jgi:uncharacterized protein YbbC (DUF1343 family)